MLSAVPSSEVVPLEGNDACAWVLGHGCYYGFRTEDYCVQYGEEGRDGDRAGIYT